MTISVAVGLDLLLLGMEENRFKRYDIAMWHHAACDLLEEKNEKEEGVWERKRKLVVYRDASASHIKVITNQNGLTET